MEFSNGNILNKERLNVTNKQRSNLFNWRGQFTPELVEYLLNEFAKPGDVIIDPFSGSGTVLQESLKKDLNVYGFEINPAAYAMSKFFILANVEPSQRRIVLEHLAQLIDEVCKNYKETPVYIYDNDSNFRKAYEGFTNFAKELLTRCQGCQDKITTLLAINILFKAENLKKFNIPESIQQSLDNIKKVLLALPFIPTQVQAFLCDVRDINSYLPQKANLVITSPPYINVFNYHQNYRSLMELFGFDLLHVAKSEFGSNRKNRSNRFKTVVQYCLDMECALYSILEALDKSGKGIMIVGRESNIRKVPFYNGQIVKQIIETIPGFKMVDTTERYFFNKFGNKIIEDILIFQKNGRSELTSEAKSIAQKNLLASLEYAQAEVKQDIIEAVNDIDTITPSPIFTTKDLIQK